MDKELEILISKLKNIHLTPEDKLNVRERLLAAMRNNAPVASPYVSQSSWQLWSGHSKSFSALAMLVLIVGISGGAVFASQKSLPGDILYPIKTNVTENIARVFNTATPVAAVNFETDIMEKRLQEAEILDQRQELGPVRKQEVGAALVAQENRLQNALIRLTVDTEEASTTASQSAQGTTLLASTSSATTKSPKRALLKQPRISSQNKSTTTLATSTIDASTTLINDDQDGEVGEIEKINSIISKHHQIMEKIQSGVFFNEDGNISDDNEVEGD